MPGNFPKGRRKDIKGQLLLPFGQKMAKKRQKEAKAKGPSRLEKKAAKDRAFRLARQAYAILSQPEFRDDRHLNSYRREIGNFIGMCKKNRATYSQAQSKTGMITGLFNRLGIKYRP